MHDPHHAGPVVAVRPGLVNRPGRTARST